MFTASVLGRMVDAVDSCPWGTVAGRNQRHDQTQPHAARANNRSRFLYTPEERKRRDASPWTMVQGVLAPIQFVVFLMSLALVLRYLATGDGYAAATVSIIVKTLVLYTIMITGSIWERQVFGRYLFAPAFFWEDVVSMLVLALHSAYLVALLTHALGAQQQMILALAAYTSYVVNAVQFVLKLRAARLEEVRWPAGADGALGVSR